MERVKISKRNEIIIYGVFGMEENVFSKIFFIFYFMFGWLKYFEKK